MRNIQVARFATRWLAGPGPAVSPTKARATVDELRKQAERAPAIIEEITGLVAGRPPVRVVDREEWAAAAIRSGESVLGRATNGRFPLGRLEAGVGTALLAPRILGQYDPFGAQPGQGTLFLVAPNIASQVVTHGLDRRDLSLWVTAHELTHAAQHLAAPWIPDYIASRMRALVDGSFDSVEASQVSTLMAVLEGHAHVVMNAIPIAVMPSKARLVRAMATKQTSGIASHVAQLVGADLKARQYRRGAAFVGAVVDQRGHEGLLPIWSDPAALPTLAEIQNPTAWLERM